MRIEIKYSCSENDRTRTTHVTLDELGYSQEDWDKLTDNERLEQIEIYVDGFDQPYYAVESFDAK